MAVEPDGTHNVYGPPFRVEHHSILPQIELKGAALRPCPRKGCKGLIKSGEPLWRQHASDMAFVGGLGLLIGEPRSRAHHCALEPVPPFPALGIDPQMGGKAGAIDIWLQRAEIVG